LKLGPSRDLAGTEVREPSVMCELRAIADAKYSNRVQIYRTVFAIIILSLKLGPIRDLAGLEVRQPSLKPFTRHWSLKLWWDLAGPELGEV
jgi:hypothetical protein